MVISNDAQLRVSAALSHNNLGSQFAIVDTGTAPTLPPKLHVPTWQPEIPRRRGAAFRVSTRLLLD